MDLFAENLKPFNTVADSISNLADIDVFKESDQGIPANKINYSGYAANFSLKSSGIFQHCHIRNGIDKIWDHLGSDHTQISIDRFNATIPGEVELRSRFLRLKGDGLCNTLRAGTNSDKGAYTAPRPIHYSLPRCISIREAARLHTYPDWFQFHRTIWHGFREIGNSVIPILGGELGASIIRALEIDVNRLEIRNLAPMSIDLLSYTMSQASVYWGIKDDVIAKRKRLA